MSVHALAPRGVPTLSSRIVAEVRDALLDGRYRAGDFFGTEKELASRYGLSRIWARDALRSLETMGGVELRPRSCGGARMSRGHPPRIASAPTTQPEVS